MSNCPLNLTNYHRFSYIIQSPKKLNLTKIVILPYLHEKKIYLNRMKPMTEYFYTTLDVQHGQEGKNVIVSVNLSEYKYYIFSERGLMMNRIDFTEKVKQYGVPVAVSQNGQNFILVKSNSHTDYVPEIAIFNLKEDGFMLIKQMSIVKCIENMQK